MSPTPQDAELILRLYELRREPRMREARDWYRNRFHPRTIGDIEAVASPSHPQNADLRMVVTYWDMAASFVAHGALDAELFVESAGEMLLVWAKLEPFVEEIRRQGTPGFLKNIERVIEMVPAARHQLESLRAYLPQFQQDDDPATA